MNAVQFRQTKTLAARGGERGNRGEECRRKRRHQESMLKGKSDSTGLR